MNNHLARSTNTATISNMSKVRMSRVIAVFSRMTSLRIESPSRLTVRESGVPGIVPRVESKESKQSRGGKRPGAGRKPNLAKRLLSGVKAKTAADILAKIDTEALVDDLLKHGSR
jgi:hypothetical protein